MFRTKHEFKAQQFRTKSYQEQYNQNLLRLKGQQEDAGLQYRQALEIVRQTPLQLNAAQSAYNQADSRYQAGLSNIFELTQAVTVLNRAEIDQVIARNNVWRAALLKSAAKGDLSDFLNQIK
ncbi:TolC family protein [Pseudarcicella hirudinis]|uniref:TolC family protein n=1 Tax=Pseudarcicella hirudinis TaxID=1079859 RepID=UPI0035E544E4